MDKLYDIIKRWTLFRESISPGWQSLDEHNFDYESFGLGNRSESYSGRHRPDIDGMTSVIEAWETEKAKSSKTYFMDRRQRAIFAAQGIEVKKMAEITKDIRKNREDLIAGYLAFKARGAECLKTSQAPTQS